MYTTNAIVGIYRSKATKLLLYIYQEQWEDSFISYTVPASSLHETCNIVLYNYVNS